MDPKEKVGQEQIHELLFSDRLSWQAIIYDLINTEQLNPWDIDISLLANKYLEKVKSFEEANFFVSSKVLLAASLLLRIKSEILLSEEIRSLDNILFGEEEKKSYVQERIDLDEDVPGLIPRTPIPRFRKVTLQELIGALEKAITTENRRIKREIVLKQYQREVDIAIPKNAYNLREKISQVYSKLKNIFSDRDHELAFSELLNDHGEANKIAAFVALLHLDNQQKVWLEQKGHFEEIWILLKEMYEEKNKDQLAAIREEIEKLEKEHKNEKVIVNAEDEEKEFDDGFSSKIEEEVEED